MASSKPRFSSFKRDHLPKRALQDKRPIEPTKNTHNFACDGDEDTALKWRAEIYEGGTGSPRGKS